MRPRAASAAGKPATAAPGAMTATSRDDDPSEDSMRLAYREISYRPGRPQTFEAMRDHPVWGVCLRALARQRGRAAWQATQVASSLPSGPPVPPTPTQPPRRTGPVTEPLSLWKRPRGIDMGPDLKRRAANDRDD